MTTHFVEIRPSLARRREAKASELQYLSTWEILTIAPVTLADAENLRKVIGPHWESRVIPANENDIGELTKLTIFGIVEQLPEGKTVPRWRKVEVVHHPDCHAPDGSEVEWSTTATDETTAMQWFTLRALKQNVVAAVEHASTIGDLDITLSPVRAHNGHCTECGGRAKGTSVQVTIVSGCRHMVREYAL